MKTHSTIQKITFPLTMLLFLGACGAQIVGIDGPGKGFTENDLDPNAGNGDGDPELPPGVRPCSSQDSSSTCFTNKTAPEILKSFEAVTGVTTNTRTNNRSIAEVYNNVKSMLPMDQKIQLLGGGSSNGTYMLAEAYCSAYFDNLTNLSAHLPAGVTINNTTAANIVFNVQANREFLAKSLLDRFWGRNIDSSSGMSRGQDRPSAEAELNLLVSQITASNRAGMTAQNVAKGVCIPALASSPVVMK